MEKCENSTKSGVDYVNNPPHYAKGKYQCIEVMQEIFGKAAMLDFCTLNAFKYLWRHRKKFNSLEDLKKAQWYLNKAIQLESLESGSSASTTSKVECTEAFPPFIKGGIYQAELTSTGDLVVYIKDEPYIIGAQWKYKFKELENGNKE